MEGGGLTSSGIQLSNIGDYNNVEDIYVIGNASLFSLFLSVIAARIGNIGGLTLNTYFDMFGLEGVLSNTMLIVLILQVTRWIYTTFYNKFGRPWSPFVFLAIVLAVQLLHDVVFYYGVINVLPSGKNEMVDILKQYAKENRYAAVGSHSIFLITVSLVAMIMKDMSDISKLIIPSIVLYLFPYILSIIVKRKIEIPPKKEVKKEDGFRDARGFY